ncbi:hypothetical protein RRG08_024409 [Elysia crispata]|uniref:CHHC U11-48K-type domain-containing protein n=1 Tax=Elysia crispata TaxID=231223 RepID=A0AAE0YPJ3_9GAST|nr:hypothetical protein RRG08_024409 [Elysia crispata]
MLQGKVSSDVASKRQQYINSMKKFVEEQKAKLESALDQLGLQLPQIIEIEPKQVCPYNKDHIIPETVFKKHCETCKLTAAGLQKDEMEAQLQDLDFAYKDTSCVHKVEIDEKSLNKVIWDSCVQNGQVYTGHRKMPRSHIEENIDLTQEDRLAMYQHVVRKSHEEGKVLSVDTQDELLTTDWGSLVKKGLLDKQNNEVYSSKLEQLAALRDMKRRRQSYRAKNVHITKKSYTEIIREVIVNQMEILAPECQNQSNKGNNRPQLDSQEPWFDPCVKDSAEGTTAGHSRHRKDGARSRDERRQKRDRRSRSRDRSAQGSSSEGWSLKAVKVEASEERLGLDSLSAEQISHHGKSRKRSSSPDSEGSDGRGKRHKKSKHKKKHSKKHKRKD